MSDPKDLETRLRAYLARGADRPAPAGLEERVVSTVSPARGRWGPQLLAAAAVVLLAIGVGLAFQNLRSQKNADVHLSPTPTPQPSVTASATPTPTASPTASGPLSLSLIHMTSVTTGWATGDTDNRVNGPSAGIFRSSDGGLHWKAVTPKNQRWVDIFTTDGSTPRVGFQMVADFADAGRAWVAAVVSVNNESTVTVFSTTDGGDHWSSGAPFTTQGGLGTPGFLEFVDQQHGWYETSLGVAAGSEGVAIFRTTNGGATWGRVTGTGPDGQSPPGSLPFGCLKGELGFANGSTGWLPGECYGGKPFLYLTHDAGQTWGAVTLPLPAAIASGCDCRTQAPVFTSSRDGSFVLSGVAYSGTSSSYLYVTHDGGASWAPKELPTATVAQADFISASVGWLVESANGTVYFTSDGGSHWSPISAIPVVTNVPELDFVDRTTGYALRGPGKGPLLKTTDGGHTWKEIQPTL